MMMIVIVMMVMVKTTMMAIVLVTIMMIDIVISESIYVWDQKRKINTLQIHPSFFSIKLSQ